MSESEFKEWERKQNEDSQADSRRTYLKRLAELIKHVETFMNHEFGKEGFDGKWYWQEGPGMFDHGLTSDRIAKAAETLRRVSEFAPGGSTSQQGIPQPVDP